MLPRYQGSLQDGDINFGLNHALLNLTTDGLYIRWENHYLLLRAAVLIDLISLDGGEPLGWIMYPSIYERMGYTSVGRIITCYHV
jgi:hypothetical protein